MENMYLDLSAMTQDFPDAFYDQIYDLSYNGLMIEAVNDDDSASIPYDAGVSVKDGEIILDGGADCGGYGSMLVSVPQNQTRYRFYVEPRDAQAAEDIVNLIGPTGATVLYV